MLLLVRLMLLLAPIGSGLSDGIHLVYESGGVAQAPWVYDSTRTVAAGQFSRCVIVFRAGQQARESCVRADTLFEKQASGGHAAMRPIGPDMQLEIAAAAGRVMQYSTGSPGLRNVSGRDFEYLPTTIVTRDSTGRAVRRLREHYAPALLTALWGVFEEPDETGGWRTTREFGLRSAEMPAPADGAAPAAR